MSDLDTQKLRKDYNLFKKVLVKFFDSFCEAFHDTPKSKEIIELKANILETFEKKSKIKVKTKTNTNFFNYVYWFLRSLMPLAEAFENPQPLETIEFDKLLDADLILHGTKSVNITKIFQLDEVRCSRDTKMNIFKYIKLLYTVGKDIIDVGGTASQIMYGLPTKDIYGVVPVAEEVQDKDSDYDPEAEVEDEEGDDIDVDKELEDQDEDGIILGNSEVQMAEMLMNNILSTTKVTTEQREVIGSAVDAIKKNIVGNDLTPLVRAIIDPKKKHNSAFLAKFQKTLLSDITNQLGGKEKLDEANEKAKAIVEVIAESKHPLIQKMRELGLTKEIFEKNEKEVKLDKMAEIMGMKKEESPADGKKEDKTAEPSSADVSEIMKPKPEVIQAQPVEVKKDTEKSPQKKKKKHRKR